METVRADSTQILLRISSTSYYGIHTCTAVFCSCKAPGSAYSFQWNGTSMGSYLLVNTLFLFLVQYVVPKSLKSPHVCSRDSTPPRLS